MGHKFSLVLNREITEEESAVLQQEGCGGAVFATDSLPANTNVPVTKLEFDLVTLRGDRDRSRRGEESARSQRPGAVGPRAGQQRIRLSESG